MIGTAFALGRIAVARQNHFCPHLRRPRNRRIKIGGLKPKENAVAMREMRVTQGSVMMLDIPPMQLQDQLPVGDEPFIFWAAVSALAAKQTLIPATARLHIPHGNKWLRTHTDLKA